MSGTKIQINSLQALERLIGGDTELELEMRKSIANEFAGKYLKTLFHDRLIEAAANTINAEVTRKFLTVESVKDSKSWHSTVTVLNTEGKSIIEKETQRQVNNFIREEVNRLFDVDALRTKLKQAIEDAADKIANEVVSSNISKRVDDLANKKIREKLGL